MAALPTPQREEVVALWDEYEEGATPEARLAKGLDKLETILQHTQGANPPDFDYRFNLGYGRRYTEDHPLLFGSCAPSWTLRPSGAREIEHDGRTSRPCFRRGCRRRGCLTSASTRPRLPDESPTPVEPA